MKQKIIKSVSFVILILSVFGTFFTQPIYAASMSVSEEVSDYLGEKYQATSLVDSDSVRISSRIYELFFGNKDNSREEIKLIPGGDVFGIRIYEPYVTVCEAESDSALRRGDKITSIGGKVTKNAKDVTDALSASCGKPQRVHIIRGGENMVLTVTPKERDGEYKLGVTLRGSALGIGTVTFIDPQSGAFGGLGHGVCASEDGELISVDRGEVCDVILGSAKRGEVGKPGELSGVLQKRTYGTIDINSDCGVFGYFNNTDSLSDTAIPIAKKCEVKCGEAEIISTVKNGKTAKYKIEITEIDNSSTSSKSFKIKVTDKALITLTGGIVRGMSGSPIIQDGKLVGAVTHVLVANPTEGYGIFIENMLNAAQSQVQPKAA